MKKTVMTRAWEIYRTLVGDRVAKLSQALKMAWAEYWEARYRVVTERIKNYKRFELGKTYTTTSVCNSDCTITLTVIKRTAATITAVDNHGEVKRLRINKKFSEYRNAETVLPWGNYSMSPMISAE